MPYDNIISRTDAAATIPEEVSAQMRANLVNESAAKALFRNVPVGRAQVRFPVLSALPVAYFVTGDTGLKQTTEVNWDNKYLNIEEIACMVPVPDSVIADSEEPIWSEVQPLMEQAIGRTLDAAIFFGTNKPASWPTDVVTAAVAAGNLKARGANAAGAGGISQDISDALALLEADGYDANGALANRSIRGKLRGARDSTGVQLPEVTQTSIYGTDIVYPMRGQWPAGVSVAELIAFDRDEFVLGVRQDITFKVFDQGVVQDNTGAIMYNSMQQDLTVLRVVFRVGWQVSNNINYDQPTEGSRYPATVLRSPAS